ncbi:FtsX-like permease family protein [Clostridium sp. Ade.TY]|uniref:ABC transporter permease n=1 Tax=Clostridium sp. Ade.TY TaxID=1391647 RepID=UPI0004080A4D|nr:FtsX-like permease family protein [Clostridium sp. Ade.TY]
MDFLFRGFLSVKERLSKSFILFLVMTAICVFVLAGFSIRSATEKAGVLARQKLGATVTFSANMERIRESMKQGMEESGEHKKMEMPKVSIDDVNKILTLNHIKSYNLISKSEGVADSFEPITSSESENTNGNMQMVGGFKGPINNGDITIYGVSNLSALSTFSNGESKLASGKTIDDSSKDDKVCVIEETLASQNNLKVGDKIKVKSARDQDNTLTLKIIGIYKSGEEVTDFAARNTAINPYNKIYVPYTVANTLKGYDYKNTIDSAEFYLDDPVNVDSFVENGKKLDIDYDTYILDANSRAYETMMGSIENVASFAKMTVIVVSIAGAVILGLIIMLSIRERRNEIGILLSIGESKIKIIGQFITETLIVLLLALALSSVLGNTVSKTIGNILMSNETKVTESSGNIGPDGFGGQGGPGSIMEKGEKSRNKNVEAIDNLDVSVSGEDYGKMCGLAALISVIAVLIPSGAIMRLQPKEILSKHD